MKHRILKIAAAVSAATGIFLSLGWPFFELTVHCRTKRDVKKWFRLSQMKVNHPRYKFEKEYEAGMSLFFPAAYQAHSWISYCSFAPKVMNSPSLSPQHLWSMKSRLHLCS